VEDDEAAFDGEVGFYAEGDFFEGFFAERFAASVGR